MTICLFDRVLPAALAAPRLPFQLAATDSVDGIMASIESAVAAVEQHSGLERRREARYPFPYPVPLTPFTEAGDPDTGRTFVVIGKHLAAHGIDFYCKRPLGDKRVIASLDCGAAGWIGLVVELAWCRFNRHGWYDNGGRFVAVVTSPLLDYDDRPRAA
jgi:hypothetical protein